MDVRATAAIIGALAGGLMSLLVNEVRDWWRIKRTTKGISLGAEKRAGSRVTARVKNGSKHCIHTAVAYISLDHDRDDVLTPPKHFLAFISPAHPKKLEEDRLCWAVAAPLPNPPSVDIFPGERQVLDIADFGENSGWVEIPSEVGWSSGQTEAETKREDIKRLSSRVFLRAGKRYQGTIKIVSASTRRRVFKVEIDPSNASEPLRVLPGRKSLWYLSLRVALSLLWACVFYTAWMGAFIAWSRSVGLVTRALLWVAAPLLTAAGFAFGLTLSRWRVRPLGAQFTRNYAWPLLGCAVGAAVVYPFGPMLIVFGMFAAGTMAVAIREAWLLRPGRNHERLG